MYFPTGFETERAIELAGLVTQAYAQFDAFRKEAPWSLREGTLLSKSSPTSPVPRLPWGAAVSSVLNHGVPSFRRACEERGAHRIRRRAAQGSVSRIPRDIDRERMDTKLQHGPGALSAAGSRARSQRLSPKLPAVPGCNHRIGGKRRPQQVSLRRRTQPRRSALNPRGAGNGAEIPGQGTAVLQLRLTKSRGQRFRAELQSRIPRKIIPCRSTHQISLDRFLFPPR